MGGFENLLKKIKRGDAYQGPEYLLNGTKVTESFVNGFY